MGNDFSLFSFVCQKTQTFAILIASDGVVCLAKNHSLKYN